MVALFPLNWPPAMIKFFQVLEIGSASGGEQAVGLDCELAYWSGWFRSPIYARSMLTAALPPIVIFCCFGFWGFYFSFYRRRTSNSLRISRKQAIDYSIVSTVVVLFMLHLGLTKAGLNLFTCAAAIDGGQEVGAQQFLKGDGRLACWTKSHKLWAWGLGGGILCVYGLGIPLAATILLRRISEDLNAHRPMFGFLFSSFEEHCFFWEIIIVLRKVAFASAAVMLRPLGANMQSNVGLIIITCALSLQLQYRPYVSDLLDNMESLALSSAFITLSFGVFLSYDGTTDFFRNIVTIIIVVVNVAFLMFAAGNIISQARKANRFGRFKKARRHVNAGEVELRVASESKAGEKVKGGGVSSSGGGLADKVLTKIMSSVGEVWRLAGQGKTKTPDEPREQELAVSHPTGMAGALSTVVNPMHGELPEGWVEAKSEQGDAYYYDTGTNQTSWTRPVQKEARLSNL